MQGGEGVWGTKAVSCECLGDWGRGGVVVEGGGR